MPKGSENLQVLSTVGLRSSESLQWQHWWRAPNCTALRRAPGSDLRAQYRPSQNGQMMAAHWKGLPKVGMQGLYLWKVPWNLNFKSVHCGTEAQWEKRCRALWEWENSQNTLRMPKRHLHSVTLLHFADAHPKGGMVLSAYQFLSHTTVCPVSCICASGASVVLHKMGC